AAYAFANAGVQADQVTLAFGWAVVAWIAASSFVLFFALSWGVVVWVLLGEMFPLRIRAAAMGVATATQWLANWLVTVSFPALSDWNLSGTYMMYAAFALLSFLLVWKFVEETKGKTLEEMQGRRNFSSCPGRLGGRYPKAPAPSLTGPELVSTEHSWSCSSSNNQRVIPIDSKNGRS